MNDQKQQHKCRHCGNWIWRAFIGSIFEGWRDLYGNICDDGYRHVPAKGATER